MTVGAEMGEIVEAGSPIIVPADPAVDGRRPLRWASSVLAAATALLALLNAGSLTGWLDERPPTRTIERLRPPLDEWRRLTTSTRLDAPHSTMHRWWGEARAVRFKAERPGEPGAD